VATQLARAQSEPRAGQSSRNQTDLALVVASAEDIHAHLVDLEGLWASDLVACERREGPLSTHAKHSGSNHDVPDVVGIEQQQAGAAGVWRHRASPRTAATLRTRRN